MEKVNQRVTKYMIGGIVLAVTFEYILFFAARSIDRQFLPYGYFAKILLFFWLFCLYLYVIKVEKQKFLLWEEKKYSFLVIFISVIAIVGLVMLTNFLPWILRGLGLQKEHSKLLESMLAYFETRPLLLIANCAAAGIVEELIFRGYLIPRLKKLFGNGSWAVIASSVLFAAGHFKYGTISNVIVPLAIGLIFGFYYLKYRNLKVLIITHFFVDLVSLSHALIK